MIRVGLVTHGMEIGGIERSIARIASGIDRDRFQPIVFSLTKNGPASDWLPPDVPVVEIQKRAGNDWSSVRRLARHLREHRIDVVQSHNWGTLLETVGAKRLASVPAHIHAERGTVLGTITEHGWKYRLRAMAMRVALRSVDCVMSNSLTVAKRVEARCRYPVERITLIPNGVPAPCLNDLDLARTRIRTELGLQDDDLLLGSVGRLHAVKGFETLVQAIGRLANDGKNVQLVIVGEGEQRGVLEGLIRELQLANHVHLVGHRNDTASWFAAMDVYVNSSLSEGMSQSIVEAMSHGIPVVATDVGDASQMIARTGIACGKLCAPGEIDSLAATLELLLNSDEELTKCASHATQCHRQFYSESQFLESIELMYQGVFNKHADRSRRQSAHETHVGERTALYSMRSLHPDALKSDIPSGTSDCPLEGREK